MNSAAGFSSPCPDFDHAVLAYQRLAPRRAFVDGNASVALKRGPDRQPKWVLRYRVRDAATGLRIHRSDVLASERDARAFQVVLATWRWERQRKRASEASERDEDRERRRLFREAALGLGGSRRGQDRAVHAHRKAMAAEDYVQAFAVGLAGPKHYQMRRGRKSGATKLSERYRQEHPSWFEAVLAGRPGPGVPSLAGVSQCSNS